MADVLSLKSAVLSLESMPRRGRRSGCPKISGQETGKSADQILRNMPLGRNLRLMR